MNEAGTTQTKQRRPPNAVLCYLGAFLSMFAVAVPLDIDPDYPHSGTELLVRFSIALLLCLGPLAYYSTHRWTPRSVLCGAASTLMLCFTISVIFRRLSPP